MFRLFTLTLFTLLVPSIAWGAEFFDFGWDSHQNDRSIYYLGLLFGQVGTVLPSAQGNEIIGELLRIFNIAVLTVGTIVVVYSTIVTSLGTAQEGEVMGKKWSSIWIPIRSATGLAMLLPTASGFSLIQILMMWIVIQGVHGGNQIWNVVISKAQQGVGLTGSLPIDQNATVTQAMNIFKGLTCMHYLNNDTDFLALTGGDEITLYSPPGNDFQVWIGVENNSSYSKVCGLIQASPPNPKVKTRDQWNRQQIAAGELAFYSMINYAEEAALYPDDRSQWTGVSILTDAVLSMRGAMTNIELNPVGASSDPLQDLLADIGISGPAVDYFFPVGLDAILRGAQEDGWIHAGQWYFKLKEIGSPSIPNITPPFYKDPSNYPYTDGTKSWNNVVAKANRYLSVSDGTGGGSVPDPGQITLSEPPDLSDEAKQAMGNTVQGFTALMRAFMSHLSERDEDPIKSFQKTGSEILITTEVIFFALVIALPIAMTIACVMSGFQPACYVLGILVVILLPILTVLLSLLWAAGVSLGIYLPMVPFFVYTFTAMGWLMLVVETIVAAPIVALGITTPGQDALGKASPAVMLITNVFLRPSLIVIGFIAAARLIKPVMNMLNYGFESFVIMNVGVLLLFGNIALIIIYAGVAITAIHQVFSLVYVLADKVIRWIGGQVEQSMVEKAMEETKKASEQAADVTGQMMKGATEFSTKMSKKAMQVGEARRPEKMGKCAGNMGIKAGKSATGMAGKAAGKIGGESG